MAGRLSVPILSALVWAHISNALVPADPTITAPPVLRRQNDANFIGWTEIDSEWKFATCDPGAIWYQNEKYAQCCPSTLASCAAPTACFDGTLVIPYDATSTTTVACTDAYSDLSVVPSVCNTAFIYEAFEDSDPRTDIVCGSAAEDWTYYRKIPASATEPLSSSSSDSSDTSTTPATTTSPPIPGQTDPPTPIPSKKKKSKAWIAGAVAGPLIGLAFIALIAFLLFRRKRRNALAGSTIAPTTRPEFHPQPYVNESKPHFSTQSAYVPPPVVTGGYDPANPQHRQSSYGQGAGQQVYEPQGPYAQSMSPLPMSPQHMSPQQQMSPPQPSSPAPQYTTPYGVPNSQGIYGNDDKQTYQHVSPEQHHPHASELGGVSSPAGGSGTAELGGEGVGR